MSAVKYRVKNNGVWHWLKLQQEYSVTYRLNNPQFRLANSLPSNSTLPISLPADGNRKALGFPELPYNGKKQIKLEAEFYLFGKIYSCGQIVVISDNKCDYQISFVDNQSILKDFLIGKSVRDCVDETILIDGAEDLIPEYKCTLRYLPRDFNNPTLNVDGTILTTNVAQTNLQILQDFVAQLQTVFPGNFNANTSASLEFPGQTSSPGILCLATNVNSPADIAFIDDIITSFHFQKIDSGITYNNPNTFWQTHMNNLLNNYNTSSHVFFTVYNPLYFDSVNYDDYINYYDASAGEYDLNNPEKNPIIPFLKYSYVLNQIAQKAGFKLTGNAVLNSECFNALTIYNNYNLEVVGNLSLPIYPISYNLSNHINDIDAAKFFVGTLKYLGIKFEIDNIERCINLSYYSDITKSKPKPLNNICDKINGTNQTNKGYTVRHSKNLKDKYHELSNRNDLQDFVVGDGGNNLNFDWATMHNYIGADLNGIIGNWIVPQVWHEGTSFIFNMGANDYGNMFMLYCGMQENSLGELYPFASNNGVTFNGVTACDCSLDFKDKNSFFQQNWLPWLEALENGKKLKTKFKPNNKDLQNIECDTVFSLMANGQYTCVAWQSLDVNITNYGIEEGNINLFRL